MLLHNWTQYKKKVVYPVITQPKLDGIRVLTDGTRFWSREGKEFPTECVEHLQIPNLNGRILDGEILLPFPYTFQDSISALKRYQENSLKLELIVFDMVDDNLPYQERIDEIKKMNLPSRVRLITSKISKNENEVDLDLDQALGMGYEGLVIKTKNSKYTVGKRSSECLKYKKFEDDEFLVIDAISGKGKFEGLCVLVFETKCGKKFEAVPVGTFEEKRKLLENKESLIGTYWTVKYFGYTTGENCVPRFPIALRPRNLHE